MKDALPQQLLGPIQQAVTLIRKHVFLICVVLFAAMYGYLLFQIDTLNNAQPSTDAAAQTASSTKRLVVDKTAAAKMSQLEDQNIEIKSLFEQARSNPFQE